MLAVFFIYSGYKKREETEGVRERRELVDWVGGRLRGGEDPQRLKAVVRSRGFEEELVDYVESRL